MKKLCVGYIGVGKLHELGWPNDVDSFFVFADKYYPKENKALVCDLLYKRAIRYEQLDDALVAMSDLRKVFSEIKTTDVDWDSVRIDKSDTALAYGETLADVYSKFFKGFEDVAQFSILFHTKKGIYRPIRIGFTGIGWYVAEERRPIEEYDNLEGAPLWLRPVSDGC